MTLNFEYLERLYGDGGTMSGHVPQCTMKDVSWLVAEVKRFKELYESLVQSFADLELDRQKVAAERDQLRATVERGRALPKRWRKVASRPGGASCDSDMAKFRMRELAEELESALRVEGE